MTPAGTYACATRTSRPPAPRARSAGASAQRLSSTARSGWSPRWTGGLLTMRSKVGASAAAELFFPPRRARKRSEATHSTVAVSLARLSFAAASATASASAAVTRSVGSRERRAAPMMPLPHAKSRTRARGASVHFPSALSRSAVIGSRPPSAKSPLSNVIHGSLPSPIESCLSRRKLSSPPLSCAAFALRFDDKTPSPAVVMLSKYGASAAVTAAPCTPSERAPHIQSGAPGASRVATAATASLSAFVLDGNRIRHASNEPSGAHSDPARDPMANRRQTRTRNRRRPCPCPPPASASSCSSRFCSGSASGHPRHGFTRSRRAGLPRPGPLRRRCAAATCGFGRRRKASMAARSSASAEAALMASADGRRSPRAAAAVAERPARESA
mmetsp:Transcript_24260/g.79114  ORF Transcript_24260/g.79114 Transcript_24260/m.79114 type:complete len:387 (+) Transcript_24260:186-1346(+)